MIVRPDPVPTQTKVAPAKSALEPERPHVTIREALELARVSRRTIYNWINAGKVEYIRTAGGSIRIFADTLFRPGIIADRTA